MEGNKDDALKCLKIGKDALQSGDRARALKFVTKARRLDPSLPVDDLLSAIQKEEEESPQENQQSAAAAPKSPDGPSVNESTRVRNRKATAAGSSSSSSATYTEKQIAIVREIKRKKDYYEILGLEKTCTVEDVRKAYRKLSLKVHPDKNKAPGAEEAFKAVSKAFQCLNNEESKKKYDLTGSDEPVFERRSSAPSRYHGGYNGYHNDFDPDEIFRQFFSGGMPRGTAQFTTYDFGGIGMRTGNQASGFSTRALFQLLPVLLIFILSFIPSSQPVYSLSRSYPYEYRFTTDRGVNYYVRSTKFEQEYPSGSKERVALEKKVEYDYVVALRENCSFEVQRKQWGFIRETPHCELLQQFQNKISAA